jgi:hypothetical protein
MVVLFTFARILLRANGSSGLVSSPVWTLDSCDRETDSPRAGKWRELKAKRISTDINGGLGRGKPASWNCKWWEETREMPDAVMDAGSEGDGGGGGAAVGRAMDAQDEGRGAGGCRQSMKSRRRSERGGLVRRQEVEMYLNRLGGGCLGGFEHLPGGTCG